MMTFLCVAAGILALALAAYVVFIAAMFYRVFRDMRDPDQPR